MGEMHRQGDLLFVEREGLESKVVLAKDKAAQGGKAAKGLSFDRYDIITPMTVGKEPNILALGETTGHAHKVMGGIVGQSSNLGGRHIVGGGDVVHEEHGPIHLDKGKVYRVIQQREFDGRQERAVFD